MPKRGSNLHLMPKFIHWYFSCKFSKQSSVKLKNGADFCNGVQVGVEILTSKIRHEYGNIFKNSLSKNGLE
jgi:hypothetical protein